MPARMGLTRPEQGIGNILSPWATHARGELPFVVWPGRIRRSQRKHAFEQVLDEAQLMPDEALEDFVDAALANPMSQPAVGSLGHIAVASGYVAPASLARAYEAEEPAEAEVRDPDPPAEAARKLKAALEAREHSPAELKRMRRRFAASNHPDRVSEALRAEAVAAMAEVNAAIDRALKRTKRS